MSYNKKRESWYQYHGLKPPKVFQHGLKDEDIEERLKEVGRKHTCNWTQHGSEIVCETDNYPRHGFRIPPTKMLVFKDGKPDIVEKRAQLRETAKQE